MPQPSLHPFSRVVRNTGIFLSQSLAFRFCCIRYRLRLNSPPLFLIKVRRSPSVYPLMIACPFSRRSVPSRPVKSCPVVSWLSDCLRFSSLKSFLFTLTCAFCWEDIEISQRSSSLSTYWISNSASRPEAVSPFALSARLRSIRLLE